MISLACKASTGQKATLVKKWNEGDEKIENQFVKTQVGNKELMIGIKSNKIF